jgi:hypothetical protein
MAFYPTKCFSGNVYFIRAFSFPSSSLLRSLARVKLVLDLELLDKLDVLLLGLDRVGNALLLVSGLPGLPLGAGLQQRYSQHS